MAGLVPAIRVFTSLERKGVDARDKRGHDEVVVTPESQTKSVACYHIDNYLYLYNIMYV